MEYIIVGDTEEYEGCLVKLAGYNLETANKVLNRMLTCPNKNDEYLMQGCKNLRIEAVESDNSWWNDPVLSN